MCNAHTGQRHGVKSAHSMPSLLHSHPIPPSPYPHRQHLVGINLGRRGTCINKGSYLLRGKKKSLSWSKFRFSVILRFPGLKTFDAWCWCRKNWSNKNYQNCFNYLINAIFASVCCLHTPSMQTRAKGRLGALALGEPSKALPLYQPLLRRHVFLGGNVSVSLECDI